MPRMGMRGAFMPRLMARVPMQHAPMRNSAFGFHRFNDRDFDRDDRFHRFRRFDDDDQTFIFVDSFGSPFFYPFPYFGYYPYGYYGYDYYGGSADGYGYGTHLTVAELQRRLARASYYHGAIDGIMGPATRRAIRAYERNQRYAG
jgi:Putative peptidoglycan binding domain